MWRNKFPTKMTFYLSTYPEMHEKVRPDFMDLYVPSSVMIGKDRKLLVARKYSSATNVASFPTEKEIKDAIDQMSTVPVLSNSSVYNLKNLKQNYPNPFTASTTIPFSISKKQKVELFIYNSKGELLDILINTVLSKGPHTYNFCGKGMKSGTYYYKLVTSQNTLVKKMVFMK